MSFLPDIKQLDQSSWSCYHLQHNTYYYGQVGYLDESSIVHPKDNLQASNNPKNKLVKHGFGIYLLNVNDQTSVAEMKYHVSFIQYQGYWDKDEKSGKGSVKYANGTIYDGTFHEGHYHGTGKMIWPSGDQYDGSWKRSKMDGSGVFRQANGFTLKGIFKNNYFIDDNMLRNPFMDEQAYGVFKKQRKQILKLKEKQQKLKHGFSTKIIKEQLQTTINKSVLNNRVPLVLSSKTVEFNLHQLVEMLGQQQKVNVFDLRRIYMLKDEQKQNYRTEVHDTFRKSLTTGQAFIISLDQSDTTFKEMFYPDIKQFYQPNGFNHLSWSREQLQQPEIRKKILGSATDQISSNFKLIVWTKFKIDSNVSDDSMREILQVRFQKIIPFVKVDCVVVAESKGEE